MERTLISFDLKADMGCLRKPDINAKYLTYNMLHRPALLGALGAILGLPGYKANGKLPDYYQKLKHLRIGVEPLGQAAGAAFEGHFPKTFLTFNNGTGMASSEPGGNLMVTEQALIGPAFRCYLLLDEREKDEKLEGELAAAIREQRAEFVPYLGKNEYPLWWEKGSVREYEWTPFEADGPFRVESLFVKGGPVQAGRIKPRIRYRQESPLDDFMYFERLPVGFDEQLMQYQMRDFAWTNSELLADSLIPGLFRVSGHDIEKIIQLFDGDI